MNDIRSRFPSAHAARPLEAIPEAQNRALERRHSLDEQQRGFRKNSDVVRRSYLRPPG